MYVYAGLACLIALAGAACAPLRPCPAEEPRPPHLQAVQARIDRGDFEAAIRYYQNDLARPAGERTRQQPDESLFSLGLLYAHYANPKSDHQKALACFTRLAREYPRSPLVEEARIWTSVLESMEKSKRVDIEIEKMKKLTK